MNTEKFIWGTFKTNINLKNRENKIVPHEIKIIKNIKLWYDNYLTAGGGWASKDDYDKEEMDMSLQSRLGARRESVFARFFKIRLGLYSKKFQKCLINYPGLSYEQTVMSQ